MLEDDPEMALLTDGSKKVIVEVDGEWALCRSVVMVEDHGDSFPSVYQQVPVLEPGFGGIDSLLELLLALGEGRGGRNESSVVSKLAAGGEFVDAGFGEIDGVDKEKKWAED